MAYHLVSLTSDICLDDPEHGEGASTGCGYGHEAIGKSFPTLEELVKYLASVYGLSDNLNDYEQDGQTLRYSKTVADHSQAQNGGWFEPTEAELAAWHAGTMKLYSENFDIDWLDCK